MDSNAQIVEEEAFDIRGSSTHLTRDERLRCLHYRELGLTYDEIRALTGYTARQIEYACTHTATPRKRTGRPPILTEAQIDELVDFICATRANRRMPYSQVATSIGFGVSAKVIARALHNRGFHRRRAMRKPPISEANRVKRLEWAKEHVSWTREQWNSVLWTDETWVTGGRHTKTFVTRRPGEEWHPDCIIERVQRKAGWMFWGSFSGGLGKGPHLFWEKDWGKISAETYMDRTVPLIDGWIRIYPHLILMQDGAPGHRSGATIDELKSRGISPIEWPPYSPDLNPIETVWNWMKDYLQDHFPENMSYDQLRKAVKEAWEAIPISDLQDLIESMGERCQAVIDANGLFTKY